MTAMERSHMKMSSQTLYGAYAVNFQVAPAQCSN